MFLLRQSTAVDIKLGPFVDKTDGVAYEVGMAAAMDHATTGVRLSKNGAAFADRAEATEPVYDAFGYYLVKLDTTDTNTVGRLKVIFGDAAVCLPCEANFQVIEEAPYDALFAASALGFDANQRVNVGQWLSQAVTLSANNKPDVNIDEISDDTTAPGNLELMYDGTGYAGGTTKLDVAAVSVPAVTLANGAHGGAATTITLQTPIAATVPNTQKVDVETIKTQAVTCAAGVTVLASVGTAATSTAQTGDTYALANGATGFAAIAGYLDTEVAAILAAVDTEIATIVARLGAITGTGWNTVLGFFRALLRKDVGVTLPTDIGGTFDNTTDSVEAIKDTAYAGGAVASVTAPVTAGTVTDKTGYSLVAGQLFLKRATAFTITFPMNDSVNHVPTALLAVAARRSIDGGALGAATNAVAEVGSGLYSLLLSVADTNGACITFEFTAPGADTRHLTVITQA